MTSFRQRCAVALLVLGISSVAAAAGRIVIKADELASGGYDGLVMLPDGGVLHLAKLRLRALQAAYGPADTLVYDIDDDELDVRSGVTPSDLLLVEPVDPVPIGTPLFAGVNIGNNVAVYDEASRYFYSSFPGYPYRAAALDGSNRLLFVGRIAMAYATYQPLINPFQPDDDIDDVPNADDNCRDVANGPNDTATAGPVQNDTDGDGFGNFCDPDFNNNNIVDPADFSLLKSRFGQPGFPDQDLNGNGVVDPFDFSRLKSMFGQPPGPSGVAP